MAVSHTSTFRIIDFWEHTDGDAISTPIDRKRNYKFEQEFADGSGDDQAQDMYRVQGSVAIGEGNDDTYDLAGGVTDRFGNTLTFATIKQIIIVNNASTAGEDITVGGPSGGTTGALITDLFDGDNDARLKIKAGYAFALCGGEAGYTVTGGSADVLVITNGGTAAISYDLIIKGTR